MIDFAPTGQIQYLFNLIVTFKIMAKTIKEFEGEVREKPPESEAKIDFAKAESEKAIEEGQTSMREATKDDIDEVRQEKFNQKATMPGAEALTETLRVSLELTDLKPDQPGYAFESFIKDLIADLADREVTAGGLMLAWRLRLAQPEYGMTIRNQAFITQAKAKIFVSAVCPSPEFAAVVMEAFAEIGGGAGYLTQRRMMWRGHLQRK